MADIIQVGKPYPLPYRQVDGAAAEFLTQGDSMLQVCIQHPTSDEIWALRKGEMRAGILTVPSAILWLWQFCGPNKKPLLTFDSPYDIRLLAPEQRNLMDIENERQRLLIQVHAIDDNGLLRGLRVISLPPDLTRRFFAAVMDQLACPVPSAIAMNAWMQREVTDLAREAGMHRCGAE
jgi:hypothetical protein